MIDSTSGEELSVSMNSLGCHNKSLYYAAERLPAKSSVINKSVETTGINLLRDYSSKELLILDISSSVIYLKLYP